MCPGWPWFDGGVCGERLTTGNNVSQTPQSRGDSLCRANRGFDVVLLHGVAVDIWLLQCMKCVIIVMHERDLMLDHGLVHR